MRINIIADPAAFYRHVYELHLVDAAGILLGVLHKDSLNYRKFRGRTTREGTPEKVLYVDLNMNVLGYVWAREMKPIHKLIGLGWTCEINSTDESTEAILN